VPYGFGANGLAPQLPEGVIDYKHTPHIAVVREDEPGPGGTTRAGVFHWEPPEELPHGVEIVARDAQKLVAAVDIEKILDADGNVKPEWRERLETYPQAGFERNAEPPFSGGGTTNRANSRSATP